MALAAPPDVVFMDVQMPDVDGLEATRRLRRAGCSVPIVALTANATDEDRRLTVEAGMTGFLTKPIDTAAIDALLVDLRSVRAFETERNGP